MTKSYCVRWHLLINRQETCWQSLNKTHFQALFVISVPSMFWKCEWTRRILCMRVYRLALRDPNEIFFLAHCPPSLSLHCLEAIQWLGSRKRVKGYLCQALCVRPCMCVNVCVYVLHTVKTDRFASRNMECVVCGCTSWAESSEHFSRCGCEGVASCVCVFVCAFPVSTRKKRKLWRNSSHTLLPSYRPSRYSHKKMW